HVPSTSLFPYTTLFRSKVPTYDLQPEMSAYEVTDALLEELDRGEASAIILNFANPDMVGHSGKLKIILELGGEAIITADHGNSEDRKSTRLNSSHVSIS